MSYYISVTVKLHKNSRVIIIFSTYTTRVDCLLLLAYKIGNVDNNIVPCIKILKHVESRHKFPLTTRLCLSLPSTFLNTKLFKINTSLRVVIILISYDSLYNSFYQWCITIYKLSTS